MAGSPGKRPGSPSSVVSIPSLPALDVGRHEVSMARSTAASRGARGWAAGGGMKQATEAFFFLSRSGSIYGKTKKRTGVVGGPDCTMCFPYSRRI